jgi:hypothetical protein
MLNSVFGLFQVEEVENFEGYANLREVFTGDKYKLTDVGLSGQLDYKNYYIATRIISHRGISFGTGLVFAFKKKDPFIMNFIKRNKNKPAQRRNKRERE